MKRSLPLTLSVLLLAAGGSLAAKAAELCIDDWSTAAPVVREERLASVETVMERAKGEVKGDIVKVTLCKQGERYVYRLLVRQPTGRHSALIVDAKEPFRR